MTVREETTYRDYSGKLIKEGDILSDSVPSKGIVRFAEGQHWVTTNYEGRDIMVLNHDCDLLDEDLIYDNKMTVIGNVYDNPEIL